MDATVQFLDFGVRVKGQLIHRTAMTEEQRAALVRVSAARRALVEAMQAGAVSLGEGWWQAAPITVCADSSSNIEVPLMGAEGKVMR